MLSQEIDHYRKRKRRTVSDLTIEDASYKLSDRQFEAWKLAMVHGMSNVEISDTMGDADIVVFPSEVQEALHGAAKRGFAIPGEEYLAPRKRAKVAA